MLTHQIAKQALHGLLVVCLTLLIIIPASGQTRITSPYSYYGLGELRFNQNFQNMGMGGLGIGFRSNTSVNDVNPASYSGVDTLSFVFEATLFSHFYQQSDATNEQMGNYTSLGSLSFSSPVTRWWSFGFGLKPFSSMGYKIRDFSSDDKVGTMNFLYEGRGGINQVFIGTAVQPFKGLSIGLNASYLFGLLERHTTSFSDSSAILTVNRVAVNEVNGWHFGLGTQYHTKAFSETGSITLGLIYGIEQDVNVNRNEVVRRAIPGSITYDTLSLIQGQAGRLTIPTYWGAGIFARLNNQWSGGLDFYQQNWEDFNIFDSSSDLVNSYRIAMGIRHNPSIQTFSNFFNRLEYRVGFRYGQTYLNPNGYNLDEFGISFGLGIPLRRSLSGVNIGFEMSQRGTTEHELIKENFYRINLGISVHERWFLRRRFF
jgi:hypothetical protein